MDKATLTEQFLALQKKMHVYSYANGIMYYDSATVAPENSFTLRGDALAELSGVSYELVNGEKTTELVNRLNEIRSELDRETLRELELLEEERERTSCIPQKEYEAYARLCNDSEAVWHAAKHNNDFASFKPYLEKVVEYARRFALYRKPDSAPYETLIDDYEKGLTCKQLDSFFDVVDKELVPLITQLGELEQPRDDFLTGDFPVDKQRELSAQIMELMTLDPKRCIIGETEHPFTTGFGTDDMRITTHYYRSNFASSMFSVLHEGGHALYELCADPAYNNTLLFGGTSMSIHESQSRFFENLVGRSCEFCEYIFPTLVTLFPQLKAVTAQDFYRAVNRAQPSLIRVEADELTYPIHIMIRYRLESALINGQLKVCDLPGEWNAAYKKHLGITVPDDTRGVLQDSHWSGGMLGYFPSYALGSAYGAQILASMKKDLDFSSCAAKGNLEPIAGWLTNRIYKYQSMLTPSQVLLNACGAPFDPSYYTTYLRTKYANVYGL